MRNSKQLGKAEPSNASWFWWGLVVAVPILIGWILWILGQRGRAGQQSIPDTQPAAPPPLPPTYADRVYFLDKPFATGINTIFRATPDRRQSEQVVDEAVFFAEAAHAAQSGLELHLYITGATGWAWQQRLQARLTAMGVRISETLID